MKSFLSALLIFILTAGSVWAHRLFIPSNYDGKNLVSVSEADFLRRPQEFVLGDMYSFLSVWRQQIGWPSRHFACLLRALEDLCADR